MSARPGATAADIAAARVEIGAALAGERSVQAAARRRSATLAALVVVAIVLTCGLATVWIDNGDDVSDGVWWALFGLFVLALLLLLAGAFAIALAVRPRARSGELLEHIPALRMNADPGAALGDLANIAAAAECSRGRLETQMMVAAIFLGLAGAAIAAQGVTFALGNELRPSHDPNRPIVDRLAVIAKRHAPIVWLHPDERYGALDPAMLLRKSALRWRRPGADRILVRAGRIRPGRLGASCVERTCVEYGPFLASQLTRPFSGGEQRPRRLPRSRGMYLESPNSLRRGQLVEDPLVPVFYEAVKRQKPAQIKYWMFFGANGPAAPRRRPPREGDWEWFTLHLDTKNRPESVELRGSSHAWEDVNRVDGRPELFAALGGHALDADPCSGKRCPRRPRAKGLRWSTGNDVGDVSAEAWYGFGGAWGHAGRPGRIGPLGPSASD